MSEKKWTAGPWEVVSEFVGPLHIRAVGQPWSVAHVGHEDFVTCEANAALISSAPDLAEALEAADAWLNRWAAHVGYCAGGSACTCGLTAIRAETAAALSRASHE